MVRSEHLDWILSGSDYEAVRAWLRTALLGLAVGRPAELPLDYEAWTAHLFWLSSCLSAGVLESSVLTKDEFEGLRLLDEVTRELKGQLRRCPHCGGWTDSELTCSRCKKALASPATQGGR